MTLLPIAVALGCGLLAGGIVGFFAACLFLNAKIYDSTCPHCAPDEIERSVAG